MSTLQQLPGLVMHKWTWTIRYIAVVVTAEFVIVFAKVFLGWPT